MIQIKEVFPKGVLKIVQTKYNDARGAFFELFNVAEFNLPTFVQDNVFYSRMGTLRGLHYQDPFPQDKLVTVLDGEIFDVVVDCRPDSPSFGKWNYFNLAAQRDWQTYLFIPKGFAHGFYTRRNAIVHYKCSDYYKKEASKGIIYNDPELKIEWPKDIYIMSEQDRSWPCFNPADFIKLTCSKCFGSGWVWREELDRYEYDPTDSPIDDTNYTCDKCWGQGIIKESDNG